MDAFGPIGLPSYPTPNFIMPAYGLTSRLPEMTGARLPAFDPNNLFTKNQFRDPSLIGALDDIKGQGGTDPNLLALLSRQTPSLPSFNMSFSNAFAPNLSNTTNMPTNLTSTYAPQTSIQAPNIPPPQQILPPPPQQQPRPQPPAVGGPTAPPFIPPKEEKPFQISGGGMFGSGGAGTNIFGGGGNIYGGGTSWTPPPNINTPPLVTGFTQPGIWNGIGVNPWSLG